MCCRHPPRTASRWMIHCITKAFPSTTKTSFICAPKCWPTICASLRELSITSRTCSVPTPTTDACKPWNIPISVFSKCSRVTVQSSTLMWCWPEASISPYPLKWKAQTLPATWELPLQWLFSTATCSKVPKHSCSSYVGHTRLCPVCRAPWIKTT